MLNSRLFLAVSMRDPCSTRSLRHHRTVILRALEDFQAGKHVDHLSRAEVAQLIDALKRRLAALNEQLGDADA